ncbi:pyridoxine 5'-phosphate synthase [Pseudomonadales bacterium]|jgi:pyridoxine 5-phosphate synthase|nr:pyridoxine 5'-phosphate synthase [Pseudomonadales bacterium]MDB4452835.1 pyridoxine 5'-phosphate synthase [bacterium]MDB4631180.1 pyridoxine 5'-phosphate synthase [Pseudomonadales bacterium]
MSNEKRIDLSINLNKIALIRNSREGNNPDLIAHARQCLEFGVNGITVHPRPDQRHIRPEDCLHLHQLHVQQTTPSWELNIEGNPFAQATAASRSDFNAYPGFLAIIEQCRPNQATLVPDSDSQLTSDHGFDLINGDNQALKKLIEKIHAAGVRVSLFMDPDQEQIAKARDLGADRIELYTGPFADAFEQGQAHIAKEIFEQHCSAATFAHQCGLGINAGHDLNLHNLVMYRSLPHLQEVSIGHALTIDALEFGLQTATEKYLQALKN